MTTRCNLLKGMAAAPAVAIPATLPAFAGQPGRLRHLVDRYFDQWEANEALPDDMPDGVLDEIMDRTVNATADEMIGVPADSADDALAAMQFLMFEAKDSLVVIGGSDLNSPVYDWLIRAVRDYLARATDA